MITVPSLPRLQDVVLAARTFPIWPNARRDTATTPDDYSDLATAVLYVSLGLVVIFLAMFMVRLIAERQADPASRQARALFRRALRWLHLGWPLRFALSRAARLSGLNHPTAMLLSRELYNRHAIGWADQVVLRSLRAPLRRRIAVLGDELFNTSAADPPATAP